MKPKCISSTTTNFKICGGATSLVVGLLRDLRIHLLRHADGVALWRGGVGVFLERPGFFEGVEVDVLGFTAVEAVAQFVEVSAPALVVEIAQQALPLFVGVVFESAFVGGMAIAPSGHLHTGVPLVEVFLGRCGAHVTGVGGPCA